MADTHNFGRSVRVRGRRVHKPRTIFWERLLLDESSSLRAALGEEFAFVPRARFFGEDEVERIALSPLRASASAKQSLARIAGRSLALWSFFGVSDLHWENLALGVDRSGGIVFGPVDVESVLGDFRLPTETKLIPTADPDVVEACRHAAGLRRLLPYLGKPVPAAYVVAMAAAYREGLDLLERRSKDIAARLARTPGLGRAPIRVMLRGTDEYARARAQAVFPPLLDAELEQMARGDIPYFFHTLGDRHIRYFTDRALRRTRAIAARGDRLLGPTLRSPSRGTLAEQGLFVVLSAFDHPGLGGKHSEDGVTVTFGRTLRVKLPSGQELTARRDLRSVVASVYLPCSCGEVRTVLAPEPKPLISVRKTQRIARFGHST